MNTVLIPARYASSRLPGKPLADINGASMVHRVWKQCMKVKNVQVAVVTDDARIAKHVADFGGQALLTDPGLPSGTDRCAAALDQLPMPAAKVINVQGDEPFIDPTHIALLLDALQPESPQTIVSLCRHEADHTIANNPNCVKVVTDLTDRALYFSRHALPFVRGQQQHPYLIHLGLYGFFADTLRQLTALPPAPLELTEQLEQLRWLQHGYPIQLCRVAGSGLAVDDAADLEKARQFATHFDQQYP